MPPFGANGNEFNNAYTTMFVANTGDDTIIQIPVNSDGTAGNPSVFVNSINGADGIVIDKHDNLWVAANQADEIVIIDKTGKVIAKLGDFEGVSEHGVPHGLLFPASPAFSADGEWLYVTDLGAGPATVRTCRGRRFAVVCPGEALHRVQDPGAHPAHR